MMLLNQCLASSNIAFGTSGARGLVTDFSDAICAAFTQSFLLVMQQQFTFKQLAIGIDNRPSSPQMAAACAGAARALGITVEYCGVLPTPALAYYASELKLPAIMITGSHIPFDRNGLKFYRPDGEISKQDEQAILSVQQPLSLSNPYLPEKNDTAVQLYITRYLSVFPAGALAGKHIGIYEHSSAGRDIYRQIFEHLGASVTSLERSNTFVPIDTEAVAATDIAKGMQWAAEYQFDAIFSTDGDGDRPLIANEQGQWLRGDIVGLLCAKALGIEALAMPVNCNTAIEQCNIFKQVQRTQIGSPYVIAAFESLKKQFHKVAGFEANGGFLLATNITLAGKQLKALPTRDALLPALTLLATDTTLKLSEKQQALPARYTASDRLQNIPTAWSQAFIAKATQQPELLLAQLGLSEHHALSQNNVDGLRLTLNDDSIIHLRSSGNAPELRCYAEADSAIVAEQLVHRVLAAINLMNK